MRYLNGLRDGLFIWISLSLADAKAGETKEGIIEALEDSLV